jgi:hypothetical protein
MPAMNGETSDPEPRVRPEPGEPRRVLDRPPGERLGARGEEAAGAEAQPSARRAGALTQAVGSAAVGAALIAFLGGPLSATVGLIAVAAVTGWVVGSLLRPSTARAISIAVAAVVVGLLGVWGFARLEGGVLDPVGYLLDVHGPLVALDLAVAAIAASVGSR